ncbi:MAG: VWA domain-containing protein [Gammaproteobacteria bacterium]|nr:VWA domain-containing protein [Gammaproteobacteria bacterium]NIR81611.1 VWA domain-containing protein [Gammaproteobacteria bacterium]NIR88162.1 VWA domain-containing protein [Gammaproteobacteria bacterium]NIU02723.1 VWA domain-containing protein [Gammaproteobacteria bacterium]NIV73322.1 VWA domain-containing protein [Gammaproteobacteria bacterium]
MSFLDVAACGFGAIILLFVISKWAEPAIIEGLRADVSGTVTALESEAQDIRARARALEGDLEAERARLARARDRERRLRARLASLQSEVRAAQLDKQAQSVIEERLEVARQELTEEMERLLGRRYRRPKSDSVIGGMPVDSEYIIFIIDTSGSMFTYAWPLVLEKLEETLEIYPEVKGIQVMNDMGQYMFSQYAGEWIPDTPARRRAIIARLGNWNPFSNSSPVEGITHAVRTFYAPDKKISLYVFGDEFSEGSIEQVVRTVDRLNRADSEGARRVRIHAVGFPVQFAGLGPSEITGVRFAALMRLLSEKNGGTFVGLNAFRP